MVRAVWDFTRSVLGELSREEALLTALIFGGIVTFNWFPKLGEVVGGFLAAEDAVDEPSSGDGA